MNVHGALNHGVWRVGVHQVEDRMNYLIAVDPRGRRSVAPLIEARQGSRGISLLMHTATTENALLGRR